MIINKLKSIFQSIRSILQVDRIPERQLSKKQYYEVTKDDTGNLTASPTNVDSNCAVNPLYVNFRRNDHEEEGDYATLDSCATGKPEIIYSEINIESGDNVYKSKELLTPPDEDPSPENKGIDDVVITTMCFIYVIFFTSLGFCFYAADARNVLYNKYNSNLSDYYNLVLGVFQMIWLIFIHVDIKRFMDYMNSILTSTLSSSKQEGYQMKDMTTNSENSAKEVMILPEHYGFTVGRHAGSKFLKIGSVGKYSIPYTVV